MVRYHEMTMMAGARAGSTYLKMMIANELLEQGKLAEAATSLQEIRELVSAIDEHLWEGELLRLEALLTLAKDASAVDVAARLLQDSVTLCQQIDNKPFALRSALTLHKCSGGSPESLALLNQVVTSYPVPDITSEFQQAEQILSAGSQQ